MNLGQIPPQNFLCKFVMLLSLCLFQEHAAMGQKSEPPMPNNVVFAQGATILINGHVAAGLERRLFSTKNKAFHSYGGLSYGRYRTILFFSGRGPRAHVSGLTGAGPHHFEFSLAMYYIGSSDADPEQSIWGPDILLGYRYMRPDGGFMIKGIVGLTGVGLGLGVGF